MKPFRIIPTLLLERKRLVKTVNFRNPRYIGDPINAVRIFNDKEVDEIVILDIQARRTGIDLPYIRKLVPEAFMPVAYGGGIRTVDEIRDLFRLGVEKVILGSVAVEDPGVVSQAASRFGSQSVVVSVDVRSDFRGRKRVYYANARKRAGEEPLAFARRMEALGAGEIFLHDVDREGTLTGLDVGLIRPLASSLGVPVIAAGGAKSLDDLIVAWRVGGAHAVAAGSLFVYKGRLRAVLINYPSEGAIATALESRR